MVFRQLLEPLFQVGKGLVGQHPVDGPQGTLLDGEQVLGTGDGLGGNVVHQRHEQI